MLIGLNKLKFAPPPLFKRLGTALLPNCHDLMFVSNYVALHVDCIRGIIGNSHLASWGLWEPKEGFQFHWPMATYRG